MQVCTSSQKTTPTSHHSVFYRPDALPAAQPTVSKHWRLSNNNNSNSDSCYELIVISSASANHSTHINALPSYQPSDIVSQLKCKMYRMYAQIQQKEMDIKINFWMSWFSLLPQVLVQTKRRKRTKMGTSWPTFILKNGCWGYNRNL